MLYLAIFLYLFFVFLTLTSPNFALLRINNCEGRRSVWNVALRRCCLILVVPIVFGIILTVVALASSPVFYGISYVLRMLVPPLGSLISHGSLASAGHILFPKLFPKESFLADFLPYIYFSFVLWGIMFDLVMLKQWKSSNDA